MNQAAKMETTAPPIAHMPAIRLAGLVRRYPATAEAMAGLGKQWQDFAHGPGGRLLASGPIMYGVHIGLFDTNEDEYFCGVEIGAADAIPAGLTELRVPPLGCAIINHDGPVSEISQTTSRFLRESTHRLAERRPFDLIERYGKDFDPTKARGDIQLIMPVEE
jgi:predicted transcriptional regulator YdeE